MVVSMGTVDKWDWEMVLNSGWWIWLRWQGCCHYYYCYKRIIGVRRVEAIISRKERKKKVIHSRFWIMKNMTCKP